MCVWNSCKKPDVYQLEVAVVERASFFGILSGHEGAHSASGPCRLCAFVRAGRKLVEVRRKGKAFAVERDALTRAAEALFEEDT